MAVWKGSMCIQPTVLDFENGFAKYYVISDIV